MKKLTEFQPRLGIVLGSGLGGIADALTDATRFPYTELEGFPQPTVAGHGGTLHMGALNGLPVAVYAGRTHIYEGGDPGAMRIPIRLLKQLGADALLVTNAAGSLRADVGPGRLMAITDHINLLGVNPLTGPNDDSVGPRFPSLRDAYDPALLEQLRAAARKLGIDLAEGVYLATAGPTFETPAEIRMFRTLGADAVGMSTVPEVGPGSLMAIADHINLLGVNPLTGPNDDAVGPRFPSLRDAYDPGLRATLHEAAGALRIELAEGVYLAIAGPSFETPAEIRAFRTLGADAVGMSTVPETILARHAGLRVVAVSAITNLAEGLGGEALSHEQTLRYANQAAGDLSRLIIGFCARF